MLCLSNSLLQLKQPSSFNFRNQNQATAASRPGKKVSIGTYLVHNGMLCYILGAILYEFSEFDEFKYTRDLI